MTLILLNSFCQLLLNRVGHIGIGDTLLQFIGLIWIRTAAIYLLSLRKRWLLWIVLSLI